MSEPQGKPELVRRVGMKVLAARRAGGRYLETGGGGGHGDDMDDVLRRVTALEGDMKEVKSLLGDKIVPMLVRIDERLNHTATKAELAEAIGLLRADIVEKPGKGYLWTVAGVLSAAVLGAVAIGAAVGPIISQSLAR